MKITMSQLRGMVEEALLEKKKKKSGGKKDACYHKVKARYDVWPSAYASGALVKCRKVGAANWGNKSKKEGMEQDPLRGMIREAISELVEKKTTIAARVCRNRRRVVELPSDAVELPAFARGRSRDVSRPENGSRKKAARFLRRRSSFIRTASATDVVRRRLLRRGRRRLCPRGGGGGRARARRARGRGNRPRARASRGCLGKAR